MSARLEGLLVQIAGELAAIRELIEKNETAAHVDNDLLGPAELARALGINDRTLRRLRAAGQAPKSIMVGGRPRWRKATVDAWVAKRKTAQ